MMKGNEEVSGGGGEKNSKCPSLLLVRAPFLPSSSYSVQQLSRRASCCHIFRLWYPMKEKISPKLGEIEMVVNVWPQNAPIQFRWHFTKWHFFDCYCTVVEVPKTVVQFVSQEFWWGQKRRVNEFGHLVDAVREHSPNFWVQIFYIRSNVIQCNTAANFRITRLIGSRFVNGQIKKERKNIKWKGESSLKVKVMTRMSR